MGLDAHVCCTCFRDGNLKTPPPPNIDVYIEDDGSLNCRNSDLESQIEFDAWAYSAACEHEAGDLVNHRIGNISLVACLRAELSQHPQDFPVLMTKVVCSGTHCCDWISRDDVNELRPELDRLANFTCADPDNQQWIKHLLDAMRDLVSASDQTGNPIVF